MLFLLPTGFADQRDKSHSAQLFILEFVVSSSNSANQLLGVLLLTDGHDEASADAELFEQSMRYPRTARRHNDCVKRGLFWPAARTISTAHMDILIAQPLESLCGGFGQFSMPFDREYFFCDPRQDRRRVPRSGADFENPLVRRQFQRLGHVRHDQRL